MSRISTRSFTHDDHRGPLRHWVRFPELKAAGIVKSWQQLFRMIKDEGFPRGRLLSPNVRAWTVLEVEQYLDDRPTDRKAIPEANRRAVAQAARVRAAGANRRAVAKAARERAARRRRDTQPEQV
jgi:predicted DNA-binding transcriptional regulator AlpA